MILRVSELQQFKRCRQQWNYASPNAQNIVPVGTPIPFTFGTMVHRALELWSIEGGPYKIVYGAEAINESLATIKKQYKAVVGVDPNNDELAEFYEACDLMLQVLQGYADYWQSPVPEGFDVVQLEQTMQIPILPQGASDGPVLQGTIDGLLRSKDSGQLWILERKTYNQRPRLDVLSNNEQFIAYMWIVQNVFGEPVGGIAYDGMWKRPITSKRTADDIYFRTLLKRPQYEVVRYGDRVQAEALDLMSAAIYTNRRWEGCHDCAYDPLCAAEAKGEDAQYIRDTKYTVRLPDDQ